MTPSELKSYVQQAISAQIGTYIYNNGFTCPAIAVGQIPNEIKVVGIEVIIPNFPRIPQSFQAGDIFMHREERWTIEVVNHGKDKAAWYTTIDRLLRYFPRTNGIDIPQANPLTSLPRYQLTIVHSDGYKIV
jgi:hypothetical protein